jgi:hypothetical protein
MKRIKFRYYSRVPHNIRAFSKDLKELETPLDNSRYRNIQKIENDEIESILPKAYWRQGTYLFPHLKDGKAERARNGMFGYSVYEGLFFYKGQWFKTKVQEGSLDRLDLHHPSKKEYDFLLQIPYVYLNRYYCGYKQHFYWVRKIYQLRQETKLGRYKITGIKE